MSIPLVRNNTRDAINTSIIAIKKNLERINSLLGLADSSEPGLSGLATKQELEDAVTEINNTIDEAVAGAKYTNIFSKDLSNSGWYKIASFSQRNIGSSVSIELGTGYYYQFSSSHKIQINYGWQNVNVLDFAQDAQTVFDKIRICYNSNNRDYMGVYVHYTPNVQNPIYLNINACTYRFIPVNFETDSLTWENTIEYNLGVNGLYINGQSYNLAIDVRNITTTGNVRLVAKKQYNVVTVYYSVVNQITAGNDVMFGRLPEGFRPQINSYGIINRTSGDSHNILWAQEVKVTTSGYVSTYTYNSQTLEAGASGCITYIVD